MMDGDPERDHDTTPQPPGARSPQAGEPEEILDSRGDRLRQLRRLGVRKGREGLAGQRMEPGKLEVPSDSPPATPLIRPERRGSGHGEPLEVLVDAEEIFTPFGPCLVAETRYRLDAERGGLPLGVTVGVSGAAVAACARDASLAGFDPRQAAFLDTETSGLSGGAGTFAFMVGLGTFDFEIPDQPAYVVRQVFMRNPAEERALLHVTASVLAGCTGLISFNGRAFDVPLLTSRYVLHHEPSPLDGLLHLDLLPAARQRWRLRLSSCALGSLEQEILALQRSQADVPGWMIPSIYLAYARGDDAEEMARVFYHNREDIVSMVPLVATLCTPFEDQAGQVEHQTHHPVDVVALGRCFEELGWLEASETAYRIALREVLPHPVRSHALYRLSWLLKRQERRDEAAAVWHDWITSVPGSDPTPYEELAKHHEWHEVDLKAARKWTLWGLHTARQMTPGIKREQALAGLQHRLNRLDRKLVGTEESRG